MRRWFRLSLFFGITALGSLLGWLSQNWNLGSHLEQGTYDRRFQLRGELPRPERTPITIVAIDEKSYNEINKPLIFWQQDFAAVIQGLVHAQAGAVGIDFIFGDVSEWDPEGQQELLAALLTASAQEIPVILGYRVGGDPDSEPLPWFFVTAAGEDGIAYVNLTTDSDDFVRRQELFSANSEGEHARSFSYALTRAFLKQDQVDFVPVPGNDRTMLINFRGVDYFPIVPFSELWRAARDGDREVFEQFKGHIILVGEIADQDRHATPLYYWVERSEERPFTSTPGIEIHAATISTMVERDFLRQLGSVQQFGFVAMLAIAVGLASFLLPPVAGAVLSAVLTAGYIAMTQYFFELGIWMFAVGPVVASVLVAGGSQAANYLLEGRQKKQLRNLFKSYVDDRVIEQILNDPNLTLEGERKHVSVLFSDICNFTTRSESMPPELLVSHLNRYFERMVQAIQSNRGTVDKFLGDGIMALFGAPLGDPDCAFNAVNAARDMLSALEVLNAELQEEGIEPIQIGVGIHTGEAVVGNIGSVKKLEYTAIGDVVNSASRIEGLTRKLQCSLLISGATFDALQGRLDAEYVGEEAVKGKSRMLPIYRVEV